MDEKVIVFLWLGLGAGSPASGPAAREELRPGAGHPRVTGGRRCLRDPRAFLLLSCPDAGQESQVLSLCDHPWEKSGHRAVQPLPGHR